METQLIVRYAANVHGVLLCYDPMAITGTRFNIIPAMAGVH